GELEVVVVAREGAVAPPLPGHPPRPRRAHDASAEALAAYEVGTAAVREHLDGTRRPERAHNEPAAVCGRWPGRATERERLHTGCARPVGIHDGGRAHAVRAAERGEPRERGRQPLGRRAGRTEEPELR